MAGPLIEFCENNFMGPVSQIMQCRILTDHLNAVNDGKTELCPDCDRHTRISQLRSLIRFISVMQSKYMDQWLRIAKTFNFVSNIRV